MNKKLILVILRGGNCDTLIHHLVDRGYGVTKFSSIGGFLRRKHTTLLIGLDEDQVQSALGFIRETCPPDPDSDEHNATLFVMDAGRFLHF